MLKLFQQLIQEMRSMNTNMTNLENALSERTVPLKLKTDTAVVPVEFKYGENSHR
jgi:DNA-binding protein YbaB